MDLLNPLGLDPTALLVWGAVAHAIADWPLQTDRMANCKMLRRSRWGSHKDARRLTDAEVKAQRDAGNTIIVTGHGNTYSDLPTRWWDRHPAAYAHAGVHLVFLLPVFGLLAVAIALIHLVIDTRTPLVWWSKLIGQTQPANLRALAAGMGIGGQVEEAHVGSDGIRVIGRVRLDSINQQTVPVFDIGTLVRMNVDQVVHLAVLAAFALITGALT